MKPHHPEYIAELSFSPGFFASSDITRTGGLRCRASPYWVSIRIACLLLHSVSLAWMRASISTACQQGYSITEIVIRIASISMLLGRG
jgi:hypothetical protein